MAALRFVAMILFLVAAVVLATDGTRAYYREGRLFTPLVKHLGDLAPTALANVRKSVGASTHPKVWDWGIAPLLQAPGWVTFGALGTLAGWLGRRRRRVIIFAN